MKSLEAMNVVQAHSWLFCAKQTMIK